MQDFRIKIPETPDNESLEQIEILFPFERNAERVKEARKIAVKNLIYCLFNCYLVLIFYDGLIFKF